MRQSNLESLPTEVKLDIFYSVDDLRTIFALGRVSQSLHNIWATYMVDIYRNLLQHHSYQKDGSQSLMKFNAQVSSPELKVRAAKDLVKLHRLARMICTEPISQLPKLHQGPDHLLRETPLNSLNPPSELHPITSRETQMRCQRAVCNLCTMAILSKQERVAFVKKFKPKADSLMALLGLWMLLTGEQGHGDLYFDWPTFIILDMWHRSNSVFRASPFSKMGEGSSCISYAGLKDVRLEDLRDKYNSAALRFLTLEELGKSG